MRGAGRRLVWLLVTIAIFGALELHRRFSWIPLVYLGALIAVPVAGWRIAVWRPAPRPVRWTAPGLAALSVIALCPVPWMRADLENPPGSAWRLDGHLVINGTTVDPPGRWYWLTVGRPPIVAEVVRSWFSDTSPVNMIDGRQVQRPAIAEPAAAAVGLRRAGWPVDLAVLVEVSEPQADGLPTRAVLSMVNGLALTTRSAWDQAVVHLGDENTFTTVGGDTYTFHGSAVPFRRVDVVDTPQGGLDAAIGGRFVRSLPVAWYRNLALGSSHGLMVALVSYAYGADRDLAQGRAIAGTGRIRGDGSVGTIGGLWAKATAARDVGADVLVFPAAQAADLEGFDRRSMQLLPVSSLDEAIAALSS